MSAARARAQAGDGRGRLTTCSHRAAVVGMPRCQCCAGSARGKELADSLPRRLWCTAAMWSGAAQDLGEAGFDGSVKVPSCAELHAATADHLAAL